MNGILTLIIILIPIIIKATKDNAKKKKKTLSTQESKIGAEKTVVPRKEVKTAGIPRKPATKKKETKILATKKAEAKMPEILKRSTESVKEDFEKDKLVAEVGRHEHCVQGHYEDEENLMKIVEDLMIMGPNCSISYERDFVAEGEKMISFL